MASGGSWPRPPSIASASAPASTTSRRSSPADSSSVSPSPGPIVGRPRILLADEPTGNLDSQMGDEVMEILKGLNTEDKATIVMVTHDQQKADQTQRIVRLFDGRQVN